jgi:predicted PurR-regulated permease PerM
MDRRLLITLLAFTTVIGGIYLLFVVLAPFLAALGWAAVIAIATFPLYKRLTAQLAGRDSLSAALMTVAVFLIIIVPATILIGLVVQELLAAEQLAKEAAARGGFENLDQVLQHPLVAPWVQRIQNWVSAAQVDLKAEAANAAKAVIAFLLGSVGAVIKNLAASVFQLLLIVIALFFLYRDGTRVENAFWSVMPLTDTTRGQIRRTTESVVSAVVIGVLVTAAVQALCAAVGYWFTGLGSVVLLSALTFVAAFIPVVGTALVWLPAAIWLLLSGETVMGIVLIVWGAAVVGSIDSVLRPLLISGRTGLPLPLMMLGALGGLLAFGLFGLVIGPLALALLVVALELNRIVRTQAVPEKAATSRSRRQRAG